MRAGREWYGDGDARSRGESVGETQVERIDVQVERLAEGSSSFVDLPADEPLVCGESTEGCTDLPFMRLKKCIALSAQTGGREADGHSPLARRLAGDEHRADRERQTGECPPHDSGCRHTSHDAILAVRLRPDHG